MGTILSCCIHKLQRDESWSVIAFACDSCNSEAWMRIRDIRDMRNLQQLATTWELFQGHGSPDFGN